MKCIVLLWQKTSPRKLLQKQLLLQRQLRKAQVHRGAVYDRTYVNTQLKYIKAVIARKAEGLTRQSSLNFLLDCFAALAMTMRGFLGELAGDPSLTLRMTQGGLG